VPVPQAIPSLPAPYAAPGPRVFNCSCSGVGTPTHWMGQVTASGYSSASASAGGACAAYYQGKAPSYGTAGGIGAANFFGPLPGPRKTQALPIRMARRELRKARLPLALSGRCQGPHRVPDRRIRSVHPKVR
jgi:hypothetical protein